MIISHKYKYLFIELPRTGSTAISKELRENYDGISILNKHSKYIDFLKIASAEEKKYFVFSCIRNPLDDAVSLYFKLITNHRGQYTNPSGVPSWKFPVKYTLLKRFKYLQRTKADFPTYFRKFYKIPYNNWSCLSHRQFDYIIRFENLAGDFSEVLKLIGIDQKRVLPAENVTAKREDSYLSYYTNDIIKHATYIFGPFLKEWKYELPSGWEKHSALSQLAFHFFTFFRKVYWKLDSFRESGRYLTSKSMRK